jgi:hypothetical protein
MEFWTDWYDGQMSAPSPLLLALTASYCPLEKLLLSKNARPSSGAIFVIFFSGGFTIVALALAAVRPVFEPIFLITKLASFFLPSFDFEVQLVKLQELHGCL